MLESSDKIWLTGEGNGKPFQYSCLENPMNSIKRQKDRTLKDELPRLVGAQYATGDQWRNNYSLLYFALKTESLLFIFKFFIQLELVFV